MFLDALPPDFVGRFGGVGGQIFQRGIRDVRGVRSGRIAEYFHRESGVIGQVARPLPGLGREGRALGELRLKRAGALAEFLQAVFAGHACVRRRQAEAAPQITPAVGGEI